MNYWHESLIIGNLKLPRFIGGPLDGITDSPFRKLVRDFSQEELLFTEMRHVACVAHDAAGERTLRFESFERPLNYQIAANKVEYIEPALHKILERGVDIIDLNVGCPAKNVTGSGSGSALMADMPRLKEILNCIARISTVPFTVKIRAGYKEKNAIDVAKLIQDCGAAALTIHPRLRSEGFTGRPDYALAAQVKHALTIPVLLSGNVINWVTARMAYEQTGVDGFLIGRGLWSKPWKLKELREHSQGRPFVISQKDIFYYAVRHLEESIAYYGPRGLYCFRKHLPFYLRGIVGASELRQVLVVSDSADFVKDRLMQLSTHELGV